MTPLDWALVLLLSIFLFVLSAWKSHKRLLWSDELLGFRIVASPTLTGMLRGWREGADGGAPLHYLLLRLWTDVFGLNQLTLRLFSTAGMAASLGLVWTIARRYFSTPVVAISIVCVYLTPAQMLWQELNGRFYGTFLAAAALASLAFLLTTESEPTPATLALTFFAHLLLIGSHILGLIYSFALIAGLIVFDTLRHRLHWRVYLSALAAWFLVPLSLHAIRASASVGADAFWTRKPNLLALPYGLVISGMPPAIILGLLLAAVLVKRVAPRVLPAAAPNATLPPSAITLIASLVFGEILLFAKSQVGTSIFSDRYLLPLAIATTLLYAFLLARLLPAAFQASKHPALSFAVLLPFCAFAASRNVYHQLYPPRGYSRQLSSLLPPGKPVVTTDMTTFMLQTMNDPTHRYLYPLDWSFDHNPQHAHQDHAGAYLLQNWKHAGYSAQEILPCPELLNTYPDFTLALDASRLDWFRSRLQQNPAYQIQAIGHSDTWQPLTLWSIHRLHSAVPPC
ncbi:MAG TPA: glycosyltransferase family 39 protein [Acidobacteriaceae bacterium]|nr:glycosyltransferase family 39 protein [Acidobacteriaceae bacterium]